MMGVSFKTDGHRGLHIKLQPCLNKVLVSFDVETWNVVITRSYYYIKNSLYFTLFSQQLLKNPSTKWCPKGKKYKH